MATLLIVDDDTLVRNTLHALLSPPHECHTADRAEQAFAYLDIESYDVVLTDISMPGLSGREVLNYVQETQPATPVIVISGLPDAGDGELLLGMGAFAFFAKPFKAEEIEEAVERAIARHQELTSVDQSQDAPGSEPAPTDTELSNEKMR